MSHAILIAMEGGIASGKTRLGEAIAARFGAVVVSADRLRVESGLSIAQASMPAPGAEQEADRRIYQALLREAEVALESAEVVVLDGCFARRAQRAAARCLARRHGTRFLLVECQVERRELLARLASRDQRDGLPPGSWLALARTFERKREPVDELPREEHLIVDTGLPSELLVERFVSPVLERFTPPEPGPPTRHRPGACRESRDAARESTGGSAS